MQTYTAKESKKYLSVIGDLISPSHHQISQSFLDGIFGYAYINNQSSAIVVFDFVECFGPFDKEIYKQLLLIDESHLVDPPSDWKKEIKKRFQGNYKE